MWSHYGDNHSGYCVGFYEEKIRNSELISVGGMVNYNNNEDYPFIDPLSDKIVEKSILRTQNKSKKWSYEKEYRVMKIFYPKIASNEDRTIRFDDDFYAEIILGLNISEKDKNEIVEIAKKKNIKIYQTRKTPFKYLIERYEIG